MIDTVTLRLNRNYTIEDEGIFTNTAKGLFYCSLYRSKSKKETEYMPALRLTKIKGKVYPLLNIEFSVPKILFGNNIHEVKETDFDLIIGNLNNELAKLGVYTDINTLSWADVIKVHYSKNILLEDGIQAVQITNLLNKSNAMPLLDTAHKAFRNGGHSLVFHSNTYEVAFYDKIKDFEQSKKSEKRSIEKDNAFNKPLLESDIFQRKQILRMEVRLNKKQAIFDTLFKKIKINPIESLSFENLFKEDISKAVLNYYWGIVTEHLDVLTDTKTPNIDLLTGILKNNGISLTKALKVFSAIMLQKEASSKYISASLLHYAKKHQIAPLLSLSKKLVISSATNRNILLNHVDKKLNRYMPLQEQIKIGGVY